MSSLVPMACSFASLLAGSAALAQTPQLRPLQLAASTAEPPVLIRSPRDAEPMPPDAQPAQVLHFDKEPDPPSFQPRPAPALYPGSLSVPVLTFEKRANIPAPPVQSDPRRHSVPGAPLIQRTLFQREKEATTLAPGESPEEYQPIQLEPPGKERLFMSMQSDATLFERMRQEARERPIPEVIEFPAEPVVSNEKFSGRLFPPMPEIVAPGYVCYGRLYFEQKNYERFGWDFGILTPIVSAATFFGDVALWPYNIGKAPCRRYDCSAGYCLPGDAVPYMLYPVEISTTGAIAEAGTLLLGFVMFP